MTCISIDIVMNTSCLQLETSQYGNGSKEVVKIDSTYLPGGASLYPYLIYGSLASTSLLFQMASRLVEPFLQRSPICPTQTQTMLHQ